MSKDKKLLEEIMDARLSGLAKRHPKVFRALERASPILRAQIIAGWTRTMTGEQKEYTAEIRAWLDLEPEEELEN